MLASRRGQDASDAHPRRDVPQVLVARHLPARAGLGAVQRGPRGPWAVRLSHLGLSVDSLRVRRHEPVRLGRNHWVRCSAHPPHPRTSPPPTLLPLTRRTRHRPILTKTVQERQYFGVKVSLRSQIPKEKKIVFHSKMHEIKVSCANYSAGYPPRKTPPGVPPLAESNFISLQKGLSSKGH